MQKYDPLKQELEILQFWLKNDIHKKANEKNKNGQKFYFCDGPPYTSGKVHLGTAWNKTLKDSIIRYKRMAGFNVLDRAGYDMHGLPTENAAEKELGIKDKAEIKKFGVDKFVKACKELSIRNLKIMNEDFKRIGVWMDFENAYQSVTPEYIDGEWWLCKRAHQRGRLYEGLRSMAWDWDHQTALAKHELEYQNVTDTSIYVKMKLSEKENEYFVIWTTTPWTIAFNLGIMANPNIIYSKCKVDDEYWIVAKDLVDSVAAICKKELIAIEEFEGKELEGKEYAHPFYDELKDHYNRIKSSHPKAHTVVLSEEYVDTSSGTGLVHMAPGCGPEDYEVGHRNNIIAWNEVEEDGNYSSSMGKFSGRHALNDNLSFVDDLDELGALVGKQKYTHQYPFGERSKKPIIFRTTRQWFFKVEDIKDEMIKENNERVWVPKAGYNAFNAWLENLRDNSISKQRYWGTPVPIWRNTADPSDYIVVGSIRELEKLSGQKVTEPHIPWIDEILIKKDGKTYKRVPDILDVWVDAGCASWNSLGYPHGIDEKTFKEQFPMDFILEGKDQIRGWFNLLHVASKIALDQNCFKACYMHGFINDAMGRKMSKSLGNYILPSEVIEKYGADTLRYYMIGGTAAGTDLNYNFDDMLVKYRNLMVLWNLHAYLIDLAKQSGLNPKDVELGNLGEEEQYILSKKHSTIKKMTQIYDGYRLNEAPGPVEELFLSLSRVYIQLTREKSNNEENRATVLATIYDVYMDVLRLLSPIAPFITEIIYQNLRNEFSLEEQSIHLHGWPICQEKKINESLEDQMDIASDAVQAILSSREKLNRGQRWPLQQVVVVSNDPKTMEAIESLKSIIKTQTNVKELEVQSALSGMKVSVKADFGKLGPSFGKKTPKIVAKVNSVHADTVLSHIEKEGKFSVDVDGEVHDILRDHLIISRQVPEQYVEGSFKNGAVYLNKDVSPELEAEGYSREVMRRVQALRKDSGLQKQDSIHLHIKANSQFKKMLFPHESAIAEKVGAKEISISDTNPTKKHSHHVKEKVKDFEFELFLEKV